MAVGIKPTATHYHCVISIKMTHTKKNKNKGEVEVTDQGGNKMYRKGPKERKLKRPQPIFPPQTQKCIEAN